MEALFFKLESQAYAINLDEVSEILNMASLRSMAEMPPFITGFLNLRGQLLPVVDLSERLGYMRPEPPPPLSADESPLSSYRADTRLLLIPVDQKKVLMIIDGLEGIHHISSPERQDDKESGTGEMDAMLIMDDGSTVQRIRTQRILSAAELEELQSFT